MVWRAEDPQGNEAGKVKYEIVPYTRGIVLDLGCGPSKAFPHFIGVDNCVDNQLFGIEFTPDIRVETCENLEPFQDGVCDAVFASHLLEHIVDTRAALAEWWRVIKPGGYLIHYTPHRELYPNIGTPGSNPDHKHDFVNADILAVMDDVARESNSVARVVVDEVRAGGREYSFLQVFRKDAPYQKMADYGRLDFVGVWCDESLGYGDPKPDKTACVVRYGGFGDGLQCAGTLAELKRQGYHVTMMCDPKVQEVLLHDPNIDAWIIQDRDQVPNAELLAYWDAWQPKFDRWVNFCGSVEGTLLAMPGTGFYMWPKELRHEFLDVNYGENMAKIAGLKYRPEGCFYTVPEEDSWADEYLDALGGGMKILMCLSGSSVHKVWPWQDAFIARVLTEFPTARIVLTGDMACKILEQGWENEPRVKPASGELTIRQTLTLAKNVDLVIGPETGVLNAVAFEKRVAKVVLLSHSSRENLSKHWVNTVSLEPRGVACWPCHRLHYGWKFCEESVEVPGTSACAASIDPDRAMDAVRRANRHRTKRMAA